jgi:hypothetical protein
MSRPTYYNLCARNRGRGVEIRDRRGGIYRGRIRDYNRRGVFIDPVGRRGDAPFFIPYFSIFSLGFLFGLFL